MARRLGVADSMWAPVVDMYLAPRRVLLEGCVGPAIHIPLINPFNAVDGGPSMALPARRPSCSALSTFIVIFMHQGPSALDCHLVI